MEKSQIVGILVVLTIIGGAIYFVTKKDASFVDDLLPSDAAEAPSLESEQSLQSAETEDVTQGQTGALSGNLTAKVKDIVGIKRPSYYKWVDERGVIHYTDDPQTIPDTFRDRAKKMNLGGKQDGLLVEQNSCDKPQESGQLFNMAIGGVQTSSQGSASRASSPKSMGSGGDILKVFTESGDAQSRELLEFLKKMNVPHVNMDVGENQQLMEQMKRFTDGKEQLPVSVFPENKVLTGFNRQALMQAIENLDGAGTDPDN